MIMTKQTVELAVLAIGASSCIACASMSKHDPMSPFYTNTLHETRANGTQSFFTFDADHSFRMTNQDGKVISGTWKLNDQNETCIVMTGSDRPPPPCNQLPAGKVGDSWDRQGPVGNEHYVLEAGRK